MPASLAFPPLLPKVKKGLLIGSKMLQRLYWFTIAVLGAHNQAKTYSQPVITEQLDIDRSPLYISAAKNQTDKLSVLIYPAGIGHLTVPKLFFDRHKVRAL
jgi:hypothetical protein